MLFGFGAAACGCSIPSPEKALLLGPHLLLALGRDSAFTTSDPKDLPSWTRWEARGRAPLPLNSHPTSALLRPPAVPGRSLETHLIFHDFLPTSGCEVFGEGEGAKVQGRVTEGGRFGPGLPGMLPFQGNNDGVRGFFAAFWGLILSVHKYFRRHKAC